MLELELIQERARTILFYTTGVKIEHQILKKSNTQSPMNRNESDLSGLEEILAHHSVIDQKYIQAKGNQING